MCLFAHLYMLSLFLALRRECINHTAAVDVSFDHVRKAVAVRYRGLCIAQLNTGW